MQKLVTIYLRDSDVHIGRRIREPDLTQQEHLEEYLTNGWSVVSITSMGGSAALPNYLCTSGWFAVLLEK